MSIVCGTDFSEASAQAAGVAARLAERMQLPLHIVHALELSQSQLLEPSYASVMRSVTDLIQEQAERSQTPGLGIDTHVRPAPADEALLEVAEKSAALL